MSEKIWKKMSNETPEECVLRICSLKEQSGLTWQEIANILNRELQKNYDESHYRKAYKKTQLMGQPIPVTMEDVYEKQKIRARNSALQQADRRTATHDARKELLYEQIGNAVKTLPVPEFGDYRDGANTSKVHLLCIADIQGGAKFTVPGNTYSLGECQRRFEYLRDEIKRYVEENAIHELKVVCLGDTLQGILRMTDIQVNETSVVEALVTVARLIAIFLNEISRYCFVEYYHVPTSNHTQTRPLGTKASELAMEDMEYIIGHYIYDMLADNPEVDVVLADGGDVINIPIYNFNVIATHGHTIKNINTALSDFSVKYRKLIDYIIMGHIHVDELIPGNSHESHDTEVIACPSFQGTDPYAYNKLGKSSKAACKILVFDERYGLTRTEKIILN